MKEEAAINPFLTPDMVEALGRIDTANDGILDQNTRFGRIGEIGFPQVEALVQQSIAQEQGDTTQARDEAAAVIPYAVWGARRAELSQAIEQLDADIATALGQDPSDDPRYSDMIRVAIELAPRRADEIRAIFASIALRELEPILEAFRQELAARQREAEELDTALAQTGTAWPIPLALRASPEQPVGAETGRQAVGTGIALGEPGVALRGATGATPPTNSQEQISETSGLTAAAVVMEYALTGDALRLEEIRREVSNRLALSDEQYQAFRHEFPRIRHQIIQALAAKGITAHWVESGHTRGKTYQLVITERPSPADAATAVPETGASPVDVSAELAPPPEESVTPEELRTRQALALADELIGENDGMPIKRADLVSALSTRSDLTTSEARRFIKDLVGMGRLFVAAKDGPSILISTSSEQPASVPEAPTHGERKPTVDTETCLRVAQVVFSTLGAARHHTQGTPYATIAKNPVLGGAKGEDVNRRAVRLLETLGFVAISTGRAGARVHFRDAQQKEAWKHDPNAILTELRAALEKADDASAGH